MNPTLYHYTCYDGRAGLGPDGVLLPTAIRDPESVGTFIDGLEWVARLVWLTDLPDPDSAALGLTFREYHRYRVVGGTAVEWSSYPASDAMRNLLHGTGPALQPDRWWVSDQPVPVVYDPVIPAGVS